MCLDNKNVYTMKLKHYILITCLGMPNVLLADYTGGRILNNNQAYTGNISITDSRLGANSGLVEVIDPGIRVVAAVPEASTWLLLSAATVLSMFVRRVRRMNFH